MYKGTIISRDNIVKMIDRGFLFYFLTLVEDYVFATQDHPQVSIIMKILSITCKTPTAGDNNTQMIDRNFSSWLATKSTRHLDVNMDKYSLKMKQKTTTTKK